MDGRRTRCAEEFMDAGSCHLGHYIKVANAATRIPVDSIGLILRVQIAGKAKHTAIAKHGKAWATKLRAILRLRFHAPQPLDLPVPVFRFQRR